MKRVLLIDDEPGVLFTLSEVVSDLGHDPVTAASGEEGLALLDDVDAVITDLSMPGMDGLEVLARARARRSDVPIILLTARGSERVAVRAMKEGAFDYLTKPFDVDELSIVLNRALEVRELRLAAHRLDAEVVLGRRVVANAPAMRKVLETVGRVARRDVPVLLLGETGTGKELVAALLHAQSARRDAPLVRFNCAAIPEELAEAELFGHAKGAFTGATQSRKGFFAEAHGGTLVLDEVGELTLPLQAKLLRALQDGEIQPLGAGHVERVDVRVIASTHRDLLSEAKAGRFREDLYYRLAVVVIRVPPLRERESDIPELARELARHQARKFGIENVSLSDDLVSALKKRPWPGNVRELENAVARMLALAEGGVIGTEALASLDDGATAEAPAAGGSLVARLDAYERAILAEALESARGNQSEAARRLGIPRPTFIARAKRFGLL